MARNSDMTDTELFDIHQIPDRFVREWKQQTIEQLQSLRQKLVKLIENCPEGSVSILKEYQTIYRYISFYIDYRLQQENKTDNLDIIP